MNISTFCGLVLLLSLIDVATASAQQIIGGVKRLAGFEYIEAVRGDSLNKHLPVLVALHFSSSSPQEVFQYYDSLGTDVRIIMPRGNFRKRAGHSWFPKDHYTKDTATQIQTTDHLVDSIAVFLKSFYEKYPIKPVVSGVSQGGDISLLLAIRYPQLVKASLPMLGFIHRKTYLVFKRNSGSVPIHLVHGEADKIVSIEYVKAELKHLQGLSYRVSIASYPGVEHDVTAEMKSDYTSFLHIWLK